MIGAQLQYFDLRRLGGLLLLLFSFGSQANTLTASIDRDVISIQETFTLTLRYDRRVNQSPDYTPLQKDFEILSTGQLHQMQMINGRTESYTEWQVVLAPKQSGVFTIPSLEINQASSPPLQITVQAQSQAPQNASSSVFVQLETDKDTAYVQEQIIVTIRLYTSVQLTNVELQPLELNNAVVIGLDEKQYQTTISGRPHAVVETRYAIFPQASGEFTLPSLTYQVMVSSGQRDLWSQLYGNRRNNQLRLRTEEKTLQIQTMPPQFSGQPWLPATRVALSEHWSHSPDNVKVGEPVTRTITITAEGLTAGQIPPLIPEPVEGLTFYPDQAQTDEQRTAQGVTGTRIETLAIVPTRSGRFTLPTINLNWWDSTQQRMQTVRLPETQVIVEENAFATTPADNTPASPAQNAEADPVAPPTSLARTPIESEIPVWLIGLAAVNFILALIFALLFWRTHNQLTRIRADQPQTTDEPTPSETALWNELKRANAARDLLSLRQGILAWARVHWQEKNIHSLQAVADRTDNPAFKQQLMELDKALYRSDTSDWDGGELLQHIFAARKEQRDQHREEAGLQPLYKN